MFPWCTRRASETAGRIHLRQVSTGQPPSSGDSRGAQPTMKASYTALPRCLLLHPHIPEVWIGHVKRSSVDVLAHGNEAGRVTVVDVGDALPEEPLNVLLEPIALLKLPLDCPDYPPPTGC